MEYKEYEITEENTAAEKASGETGTTVINWKQKLTSRKLWAAVVGVIVGLAAAFGLNESEWAEVAGIVTSLVSVVAYIFGEAKVDAARIESDGIRDIIESAENELKED